MSTYTWSVGHVHNLYIAPWTLALPIPRKQYHFIIRSAHNSMRCAGGLTVPVHLL